MRVILGQHFVVLRQLVEHLTSELVNWLVGLRGARLRQSLLGIFSVKNDPVPKHLGCRIRVEAPKNPFRIFCPDLSRNVRS